MRIHSACTTISIMDVHLPQNVFWFSLTIFIAFNGTKPMNFVDRIHCIVDFMHLGVWYMWRKVSFNARKWYLHFIHVNKILARTEMIFFKILWICYGKTLNIERSSQLNLTAAIYMLNHHSFPAYIPIYSNYFNFIKHNWIAKVIVHIILIILFLTCETKNFANQIDR